MSSASDSALLGRRGFLVGTTLAVACHDDGKALPKPAPAPPPSSTIESASPSPPAEALAEAYPLFEAFPRLEAALPRTPIGLVPSRVENAEALSRAVGHGPIFVKRDDQMAEVFGGGKVRKLELYFGDATRLGKREVVTFGGVGSNQAAAVSLIGKSLGFKVRLYLAPQPLSSLVTRNLGADASSGAELRLFSSVHEAEEAFANEERHGNTAYAIGAGGTTPIGTLGFVSAGLELAKDVRRGRLVEPKRIYIALGLGGSATGLAIGAHLGGLRSEIVAVRASNPDTVTPSRLRAIHDETIAFAQRLDPTFPRPTFADLRIRIDGRFLGRGYGTPTEAGNRAIETAREREGWELEPVYTAKALAALIADASDDPTLFWSTQSSRPVEVGQVPAAFEKFVTAREG